MVTMPDGFSLAFIIFLICVAEFAFGWKAWASWEKTKEKKDAEIH